MSQLRSGDATLMQELGEFPDDDLKVEQFEKECRTVQHSVPKDGWVAPARSSCYLTNCETASLITFSVGRSWIHKWETVWRVTSSRGSWSPDGKHKCHSLGVRGTVGLQLIQTEDETDRKRPESATNTAVCCDLSVTLQRYISLPFLHTFRYNTHRHTPWLHGLLLLLFF